MSVPLSDFCDFVQGGRHKLSGKDFVEAGYPAYGAGGVNGLLPQAEFNRSAVILSAIGARCGKCFLAEGKWSSLANTQIIFPDPQKGDVRYLYYQLNDEARWPRKGLAQPFIRPSDVKAHLVHLPPLDEQLRIATILDKADALRRKRKRALDLLDGLMQSLFVEMFGDLLEKGAYQHGSIGDWVADFETGKNMAPDPDATTVGGFRVLKVSAVTSGRFAPLESKPLPAGYAPPETHFVREGDLLFSRANTEDLIGAVVHVDRATDRLVLPDKIWRFRWRDGNAPHPSFIHALFSTAAFRREVSKRSTGTSGSMKNISKEKVLSIQVGQPTRAEQEEFVKRRGAATTARDHALRQSLSMDSMFASLQHRAFTGQL